MTDHRTLAKWAIAYHKALLDGGLPPDLVDLLVREWHHQQCRN